MRKSLMALLLLTAITVSAEEYSVYDYTFYWTYFTHGDVQMQVVKDEDTTLITLTKKISLMPDRLRFTAEEAIGVGEALKQVDEIREEQKGKEDAQKNIKVGDFNVFFFTDKKSGFNVVLRKDAFLGDSLVLSRTEAKAIAPKLMDANKLIDFLDEKIPF